MEAGTPDRQEVLWQLRILWEDPGGLCGGRGSFGVGMEEQEEFYQVEMRNSRNFHIATFQVGDII